MWRALDRFGFKGGTVLEPGAGIGIFAGLMPEATAFNSSYTGIEFDPITGGILQQLFPDERILVESFIDTKLPKNFYDVAIGNPPFSGTPILADPEYRKLGLKLHDYFFAKTIDRIKPGGLVMFVSFTSTSRRCEDVARGLSTDFMKCPNSSIWKSCTARTAIVLSMAVPLAISSPANSSIRSAAKNRLFRQVRACSLPEPLSAMPMQ
jgi:hypothetical protein